MATEIPTSVVSPSPSKSSVGSGQRKSSSLPTWTVEYLKNWMMSPEHVAHPYPTEQEKVQIMADTDIELKQLTNWFVNNRKRYWKPRIEARLQHQAHSALAAASAHAAALATVINAAANNATVTPVVGFRPTISVGGLVSFNMPRSISQNSLVTNDIAEVLDAHKQTPPLHLISDNSSSASASLSVSEGGDTEQSSNTDESDVETTSHEEATSCEDAADIPTTACCPDQTAGPASSQISPPSNPLKKRSVSIEAEEVQASPRKKFRRVSLDIWRDTCKRVDDVDCTSLPTLEEATHLFGYAISLF